MCEIWVINQKAQVHFFFFNRKLSWVWLHLPLIPALWSQRQGDLCEFEAHLIYRVRFRTANATQRNPVRKTKRGKKKKKGKLYDITIFDCERYFKNQ